MAAFANSLTGDDRAAATEPESNRYDEVQITGLKRIKRQINGQAGFAARQARSGMTQLIPQIGVRALNECRFRECGVLIPGRFPDAAMRWRPSCTVPQRLS